MSGTGFIILSACLSLFFTVGLIQAVKNAVPRIVKALEDEDSGVRRSAITTLSEFAEQRKQFCRLLSPVLIHFSAGLLQAIKIAVPVIVKAREDENLDVRRSAVTALTEICKRRE